MSLRVRLTPRARDDLLNIGRYTEQVWGRDQRDKYLRALDARFNWLAEHPRAGRHRPDVRADYYSFPQGSHVVFYLISDDAIDIIGIPHQEMDIISYFDRN